jgi:putative membrane protein
VRGRVHWRGETPRTCLSVADIMIQEYSDHAANERTFLAWIRTGIVVIAFGFVVEKFNLFMIVLASRVSVEAANRMWIDH